jgi:phospholipid transport system substrate-binding protein
MKSFKKIWTKYIITVTAIFAAFGSQLVIAESAEASIESPLVTLERTSQQVLKILRDDHELLAKEPDRVYKLVDDYILPLIDEVTMAKLAMGKSWNKASREQKQDFVSEFKDLLVRTYSKSLAEFKDQDIKYFPISLADGDKKVSVKAEIIQPGGPSIPVAYRMRIKDNEWKVYDIKIDGISLVTSYRGTFTQEIRKSGIDGLLQYLRDKNSKLSS